ncbi:MAG: cardiolipin synthase [Flavobacteriaceae bacterium]|nr:cardiolipin synthase [Flavobacteriaceae bacterium]
MDYLNQLKPFVLISYYVFVSVLIFLIILDNKKPEKSFAYIFLILLFPVGGALIYFLLGVQYHKKKLFTKKRYFNNVYLNTLKENKSVLPENLKIDSNIKLPTLFYNIEQVKFTLKNDIQLLINGEEKFPILIEELKKAKKNIYLDYYIFNDDQIGTKIIALLCEKAMTGIEVKIIYDDVGSSISRKNIEKLKKNKVQIFPYMPVMFSRLAHKANYRNHRKMVIIDNKVGFLGGINISDKYINPNKDQLFWRDTHLLIKGEAVMDLQYIFISDWYFVSGQKIKVSDVLYQENSGIKSNIATCVLSSDYGSNSQSIMEAFFGMITSAREEILITTPYFLPNETILNALKITAKSGVHIKIMIPKKPDIKTAFYASQTYLKSLLESGVEVYYYTKGMMHAKTMIIDNYICTVGSTNMDHRSFNLNAEVNAFIIDKTIASQLKLIFENDLKNAYKLDTNELNNRKWYNKVTCSVARLFAPVL